jgi:hypothetical protein
LAWISKDWRNKFELCVSPVLFVICPKIIFGFTQMHQDDVRAK